MTYIRCTVHVDVALKAFLPLLQPALVSENFCRGTKFGTLQSLPRQPQECDGNSVHVTEYPFIELHLPEINTGLKHAWPFVTEGGLVLRSHDDLQLHQGIKHPRIPVGEPFASTQGQEAS